MLSSMGSSSRFTVEAMIRGYHEYKKGESMQLLKHCEEHLQLSCEWETRLLLFKGCIKGWLRQTTQGRNWQKNLANCGDLPNLPKFSLHQSFLLYIRYMHHVVKYLNVFTVHDNEYLNVYTHVPM